MASHHPSTTIAEGDYPIRALCRQRLIQPTSNVEPLSRLSLYRADLGVSKTFILAAPPLRIVRDRSTGAISQ